MAYMYTAPRPSDCYGHNCNEIGGWYHSREELVRVGLHGYVDQVVYKNMTDAEQEDPWNNGAYSIVITDTVHAEEEKYIGSLLVHSFWWQASNPYQTHQEAELDGGARALTRSMALSQRERRGEAPFPLGDRTKVRVIRGLDANSPLSSVWNPIHGFRYDGLYEVVDSVLVHIKVSAEGPPTNKEPQELWYKVFKLERLLGQPPLILSGQ